MNVHASYIGVHERSLRELMDEGFDLPAQGAVLTYRDRKRDRRVTLLLPSRAVAEARAAEALRARRARREEVEIRSIEEAVA